MLDWLILALAAFLAAAAAAVLALAVAAFALLWRSFRVLAAPPTTIEHYHQDSHYHEFVGTEHEDDGEEWKHGRRDDGQ